MARVRPARRCSARRHGGLPCRAYAIAGGSVCRMHGGGSPAVQAAARRRVEEGRVIARVYRVLLQEAERRAAERAAVSAVLGLPPDHPDLGWLWTLHQGHPRTAGQQIIR